MNEIREKRLFNIYGDFGTGFAGNVWDSDYIAPTLQTMQGGGQQPMVLANKRLNSLIEKTDFQEGKVLDLDLYNQSTNGELSSTLPIHVIIQTDCLTV